MSSYDLIITNAIWNDQRLDVLVRDGLIAEVLPTGNSWAKPVLDASGLMLLPSLIDAEAHIREPGFEHKETLASALDAALCGGFGQVLAMPDTNPVCDHAGGCLYLQQKTAQLEKAMPRLHPVGALTKGLVGKELAPAAELAAAGCVALGTAGYPIENTELLRRALEYAATFHLPVILTGTDFWLGRDGAMNEGALSGRLGIKGVPRSAEALHIARGVLLAAELETPLILGQVTCRASIEILAKAKALGVPVVAQTAIHYLLWDEHMADRYNTQARVSPPLRTRDDMLALRQAVREGIVDMLVSGHEPHADYEKEVPFSEAPAGISALDTALSLTFSLVKDKELSVGDLVRLWHDAPASFFSLKDNPLQPGAPANFLLFEPEQNWIVTPQNMRSQGKNTPAMHREVCGQIMMHILDGQKAFTRDA